MKKIKLKNITVFLGLYFLVGYIVLAIVVLTREYACPSDILDCLVPTKTEILIGLMKAPFTSIEFWIWEFIWPVLLFNKSLLEEFLHQM